MKFSHEDIKDIAELARLELSQEELSLYESQLSTITNYIDNLQVVKINKEEIKDESDKLLVNVWRDDKAEPWDVNESEDALNQAERETGLIKVKRVL